MKRKIIPKQKYTTYASFPLVSGDVRAYEIELDLGENVSGAEFKVVAIRADGKAIEDLGTVENGIARYTLSNSMYAVQGELTVRLQILHNSSVLTDREIIFEVKKGATDTTAAQTVMPLNDSVILRVSAFEDKLLSKVDKQAGMGLSTNDFSDQYKQKLDNLDETMGAEIEQISETIDNLSDSFDEHTKDKANPHNVTAQQVGAYSKSETDNKLYKKADKSDISNVYSYQGSVDTFEDIECISITLVPNGEPTCKGQVCGSFNEDDGCVTIDEIAEEDFDTIIIPIKEVTLKKGYYAISSELRDGMYKSGIAIDIYQMDEFNVQEGYVFKVENDTVINLAHIFRHSDSLFGGCTGDVVCTLTKMPNILVDESSYNEQYGTCEAYGISPSNGSVYNVLDTGINYAWNGTEWDALGGEHKDLEAREEIKKLSDSLDCIDISDNNISFNRDKNTVGIIKEIGSFTCTAIDESTNKYTFDVADTSVFVSYTEYKVTVDDVDYLIRSTTINEDNVVFEAVDDAVPFEVGNTYNIRFETKNATSFGVDNTVLANEGFATGMANFIDETGDQGVANGYGNKLSGKAHFVAGSSNDVSEGSTDTIFGSNNIVKGSNKLVAGLNLLAELTASGSAVLGKYNIDVKDALVIVGIGYDKNHRQNALVMDKNGNIVAYGTLTVDNNVSINGELNVCNKAVMSKGLEVNGETTIDGSTNIKGAMAYKESEVVNLEMLSKHTGIDIGRKGAGYMSVVFNHDGNEGSGYASFTAGTWNKTTAGQAATFGHENENSGFAAFTAGTSNKTTKDQGATFGYSNENHGWASFIAGAFNKIKGAFNACVALGRDILINADNAIGIGRGLNINKANQVVVGAYNKPDNESVFIAGCGTDDKNRKNAITVRESDGRTKIHNGLDVEGLINGVDLQELKTQMGDINTALEAIIEIDNKLIGGDGE